MTHQEKIEWMALWAVRHNAALALEGECGFGRECVGILSGDTYPEYEWSKNDESFERVDANGDVWIPEDAYHKHPCVAVLGRGPKAEAQLYEWLKWFDANNFQVERGTLEREQPFSMIEIMLGKHEYVRMVRGEQPDSEGPP